MRRGQQGDVADLVELVERDAVDGDPAGEEMGYVRMRRGHMALLPRGSAYRFEAATTSVLLQQTCLGDDTIERWAQICQTTPRPQA